MLDYDMPLWRPPSEGDNLIIQATIGCSFNRCGFCSMYRSKQFRARPLADVFADIETAAALWPEAHRVFLADGDALVPPLDRSEEHTSELQSRRNLVCRLLLEKKKKHEHSREIATPNAHT